MFQVYFIWVARTQTQFEWMLDIIQEVEQKDTKQLVSCHIFITQFYQKYDLRTILLYICEKHYQRFCNKSMFTNLKAVTHFSRPNFNKFFKTVENIHNDVRINLHVSHICVVINLILDWSIWNIQLWSTNFNSQCGTGGKRYEPNRKKIWTSLQKLLVSQ